jgi:uncharacterized protein YjdB
VTSVKIKKINGKKLKLKKNFKVFVKPYRIVKGKKVEVCRSIIAHVVGKNNKKFSNVKKLILKKSAFTIKAGKTKQIRAQYRLVYPDRKQLTDAHAPTYRYASTNKKVAKVTKQGEIKAVRKGKCTIYVYAKNGYAKAVKVTVK